VTLGLCNITAKLPREGLCSWHPENRSVAPKGRFEKPWLSPQKPSAAPSSRYSAHRGRLWIAAAAKKPSREELAAVEQQHRQIWESRQDSDSMPPFPDAYPAACLLGCVDVTDVLPQEEYAQARPCGESGSPYVFVCRNPRELVLKVPIKGQHKLWKLDPDIHKAAKRALKI